MMSTFHTKRASDQVFGRTEGQAGGEEGLSHSSPPGQEPQVQGGEEAGKLMPGARDNEEKEMSWPQHWAKSWIVWGTPALGPQPYYTNIPTMMPEDL